MMISLGSDLLMWFLACFGATLAVTVFTIGAPIRWLADKITPPRYHEGQATPQWIGYFVRCPACVGFWIGVGFGWAWWSPTIRALYGLVDGLASGAVCWIGYVLLCRWGMREL